MEKTIAKALKFWRQKRELTQAQLAKKAGYGQNTISGWETGNREPSWDDIENLCSKLDVSLIDFLTCNDAVYPESYHVPLVKARPYAGSGGLETDGDYIGWYSFHTDFLCRKGSPDYMRLFEVAGDSMTPTLNDGDMILVDLHQKDVQSGRIYLLRIGEELMVKRLERRPGGILIIKSDNTNYEPIPVKIEQAPDVEVFGRMVWSCREY